MLNIAIDGYSGAGKSTLASMLAKRLHIKKFDTGAIYRGLAGAYLERNLPQPNEEIINEFIKDIEIEVFFEGECQHVVVNGRDYTSILREERISKYSSLVSPFPKLRDRVLMLQRDFAKNNDCVMEGRDIASVVLPNADVKFFLTCSLEVRAKRRLEQLKEMGLDGDYNEIYKNLEIRDHNDLTRKVAPLVKVEDAVLIDGSFISLDEMLEECLNIICQKTGRRG